MPKIPSQTPPSDPTPCPTALDLYDDLDAHLNACEDLTAILKFCSEVAGNYDLANATDLAVWRGFARIHGQIAAALVDAHAKTTQLFELATKQVGAR